METAATFEGFVESLAKNTIVSLNMCSSEFAGTVGERPMSTHRFGAVERDSKGAATPPKHPLSEQTQSPQQ